MKSTLLNLWRISPLTFVLERLFFLLQFLSLANILFGTRAKAIESGEAAILKRARQIEGYWCAWLALDIFCAVVVATKPLTELATAAGWIALVHIFEMCHSAINIGLFDHLRLSHDIELRMASSERVLILTAINFVQMTVCFATFYGVHPYWFSPQITNWFDALYFSSATQLTIGYGDIAPLGLGRIVAAVQGFIGFFFAVAVIGRFITFLPTLSPLGARSVGGEQVKKTDSDYFEEA